MPPTLGAALGLAFRAVAREPWLVAAGAVVVALRRVATWPAWAVLLAVALAGAWDGFAARPFDPAAPLEGALAAASSPRSLSLVAGLWLAGALAAAALRVAWLAGALPTLGGAMAGERTPRFARGVAYGLPRVLAAAALALAAELGAGLFALALGLGALRISAHAAVAGGSAGLAAAVALALVVALAVPLAVGAVADAALARAAVRADGPARAFAEATARLLARPGAFLLAALAFGAAAWIGPGGVEAAGGVVTGFAARAGPVVLLGPNLMIAAASVVVAAALDLLWLATVTALACGEGARGGSPREEAA